ncbi:Fusaric acid resistance protein-like-domain-containing protein [Amylocarpus encephaloides]|uniref:Fusaric acid resistance protein-like-domain-containing protein n=1 Tax=Amylocarpus encephaloides TaxID=45428 RepID=A0A9P8C5K5_9HELO|nr:Fusaric acid resistance protein-like-domain-containing protein [Amylocarpus encephaloides]
MSSPSPSDGPAPAEAPPQASGRKSSRWSRRTKLKNGTFILPATGERVRRQITLRNPGNFQGPHPQLGDSSNDDYFPLRRTYSRAGTFRTAVENTTASAKEFWRWLQTPTAKGVLKCSLAYLLGSMGTFLPPLAHFLGKQDGKHIVATITVYFHPARSVGSMEEGILLGLAAFLYATFIAISGMATSVFFESQAHLIGVAYALIIIVFCGGGLGLVGWLKQKFNSPLVNVAASTASIAIITVLTKENAVHVGMFTNDKIVQVMKMVIMGLSTSFAVSMLVWPVSARTELRETMIKTTDSLSSMLTMITRGFLSGSETDLRSSSFTKALAKYKSVYSQMTKNLREAKFEHYFLGHEEQYKIQDRLVNCMQRLSQSIGGLRSAAATQFTLLREMPNRGGTPNMNHYSIPQIYGGPFSPTSSAKQDRFAVLTAIEEASEEGSGAEDPPPEEGSPLHHIGRPSSKNGNGTMPTARTPSEIFSRFILQLGPSMKSLAYTLSQILDELPFGEGPEYAIAINEHFQTSLTDAIKLYSVARSDALRELYKSKDIDRDRPPSVEADFEEVAASCGHFSFSLLSFAEEMQNFMTILEELKDLIDGPQPRSWKWLRFWWKERSSKKQSADSDPERESLIDQNRENDVPKDLPTFALQRRRSRTWKAESEGQENPRSGLYRYAIVLLRFMERDDIRFAIKVGIGAALWSMFAFIPETRPIYRHWRGEWGLVSFMLVCSMTIGASNTTGYARFLATFVGAISATLVWASCQGNPFALAFCGWLFSIPCFYLIVAKGKGPLGRFTLLTYNLSALYSYSLSVAEVDDDSDEGGTAPAIIEIASHRVAAVLAGVVWGLIITRVVWPISARQKFKDGLSLLWLRMGLIWKRDPLSAMVEGESKESYMNLREEFILQRYVLQLDNLRDAATNEFELRGPFPSKAYGRIIESTNKMLNAFHAMNLVIEKDPTPTDGETLLLKHTLEERMQLCARISHLFQVLASSLRLEYPMNDALPSAERPRDRLLTKIFQYRKSAASSEDPSAVVATDEDYELLYAYALVTGQLAEEIKKIEKEVELLFGVVDEDLLKLQ